MSGDVTVKLNRQAIRDLLNSNEVQQDLQERADRIATAAGPGHVTDVHPGRTRAHAAAVTATGEAMAREARDRNLTRALDAGRD